MELRKRIKCFIFWPVFLTLKMQWSTKVKNIGGGGGGGRGADNDSLNLEIYVLFWTATLILW